MCKVRGLSTTRLSPNQTNRIRLLNLEMLIFLPNVYRSPSEHNSPKFGDEEEAGQGLDFHEWGVVNLEPTHYNTCGGNPRQATHIVSLTA